MNRNNDAVIPKLFLQYYAPVEALAKETRHDSLELFVISSQHAYYNIFDGECCKFHMNEMEKLVEQLKDSEFHEIRKVERLYHFFLKLHQDMSDNNLN